MWRYGYTQFKIHLNIPNLNERAVPWRLTEEPYSSYLLQLNLCQSFLNIFASRAIYSEHLLASLFKLTQECKCSGPSSASHFYQLKQHFICNIKILGLHLHN